MPLTTHQKSSLPSSGRRRLLAGIAGILVITLIVLAGWASRYLRSGPKENDLLNATPPPKSTATSATRNPRGYVGIQSCEACHAERVRTFRETRHSRACLPPDSALMPTAFAEGKGRLETSVADLHFEMVKEGNDYIQKTVRTPPN